MTSLCLSHLLTIPLVEEDQHQTPVPPLTHIPLGTSNSPPIFFDPLQSYGEGGLDCHLQRERKLEPNDHSQMHGSSDCPLTNSNISINEGSASHQLTREGMQQQQGSRGKMMNIPDRTHVVKKPRRTSRRSFQDQGEQQSNNGDSTASNSSRRAGIVRVCSDCKTTTTPLWRTGPSGPKSLCNACGIRQRKARRAAAAAAAVLSGGLIPAIGIARSVCKKKNMSGADLGKKHCFNDIVVRLSRSSAFHQVFPQDEMDAAILLMALSCGLILS